MCSRAAVRTGVDSALYAVGLKDEVKGTGVFGSVVELKREGGTAGDKLSPEVTERISAGLFLVLVAAACAAITSAGL